MSNLMCSRLRQVLRYYSQRKYDNFFNRIPRHIRQIIITSAELVVAYHKADLRTMRKFKRMRNDLMQLFRLKVYQINFDDPAPAEDLWIEMATFAILRLAWRGYTNFQINFEERQRRLDGAQLVPALTPEEMRYLNQAGADPRLFRKRFCYLYGFFFNFGRLARHAEAFRHTLLNGGFFHLPSSDDSGHDS